MSITRPNTPTPLSPPAATLGRRRRLALALAALVAAVTLAPAPAAATGARHRGWEDFESPLGRIYGNVNTDDGFVAITGGTIADVCSGNPPGIAPGIRRQRADGTWRIRTLPGGFETSVSIYETDLSIFDFIPAACQGQAEGQPLPEAFASGQVVLRDSIRDVADASGGFETNLPGRYRNGVRGVVDGADGARYRVRTLVDFVVDEDGSFTPSVEVFTLRPLGRHRH